MAFYSNDCSYSFSFIQKLMELLPIDSYGECFHNTVIRTRAPAPIYPYPFTRICLLLISVGIQKVKIHSFWTTWLWYFHSIFHSIILLPPASIRYKFVLVVEPSAAHDFVSENLLIAWLSGSVPVYWGAHNVDEWTPGVIFIEWNNNFF